MYQGLANSISINTIQYSVSVCIYVYMYVCVYVNLYIRMYVFSYILLCMYIRMYVCMYIYTHICMYNTMLNKKPGCKKSARPIRSSIVAIVISDQIFDIR